VPKLLNFGTKQKPPRFKSADSQPFFVLAVLKARQPLNSSRPEQPTQKTVLVFIDFYLRASYNNN
jgi:hypothetical protein